VTDNVYNFISLAMKAGKVVSGEQGCEKAVKNRKTSLVIIAEDASSNTEKKFRDACAHNGVSLCVFGEKEKLGRYLGKSMRSVIAVTDENFSGNLIKLITETKKKHGGGLIE